MDVVEKLKKAQDLIKEAERLVKEASRESPSLQAAHGVSLEVICQQLNRYSDNSLGYSQQSGVSIGGILASEGKKWKVERASSHEHSPASVNQTDSYFPPGIRRWIQEVLTNAKTESTGELVKRFIDRGIDKKIAVTVIEGERQRCSTKGGKYQIDFRRYEPIDDRIFSASQMYDFAYGVSQDAMGAAFEGKKSIGGKSLSDFIEVKLDKLEGDGSYEQWVPKNEWPKEIQPERRPINVVKPPNTNQRWRKPRM